MTEGVILAIIGVLGGLATLYLKGKIDAKAKEAEIKQAALEVKIDGRLTQLLEVTKKLAEAVGHKAGMADEKAEEKVRVEEKKKK